MFQVGFDGEIMMDEAEPANFSFVSFPSKKHDQGWDPRTEPTLMTGDFFGAEDGDMVEFGSPRASKSRGEKMLLITGDLT